MELSEAIRCILDGEAILFAGSGFSADAINKNGKKLCVAKSLAHRLLEECGFSEDDYVDDLGQASEVYKEDKGLLGLQKFLLSEFTAVSISAEQQFISTLPWFRIYTTNYDNVIEKAFLDSGKNLATAVLSDRQDSYRDKRSLCVYLNGSLSRISVDSLQEEIKLTNSSYLTDSFRSSPWINFFQTDLKTAKAIFFIGYSMQYDIDIQRIVFNTEELKNKTFFIMWDKEPKVNLILVKKYGFPLAMGMTAFMNAIKDVKKDYISVRRLPKPYLCFDQLDLSKSIPLISDKDAFDLFLKGDYGNYERVYYSLVSPESIQFCVYRSKLDCVLSSIKSGLHNFVIHSSLGNGKTMFLLSLATLLSRNGFKVYFFQKYRATIAREIEQICEGVEPTVVIFDRYSDCFSYLEILKSFRRDQVLIVAERSALNDIYYSKLVSLFGDFESFDLNQLDDTETVQFSSILTRYGLWGERSNYRETEKISFINANCRRSIAKTILQLLRSPNLLTEYRLVIDKIKKEKGYYNALVYILVSQVAGFSIDTDDLVNLFDSTQLNSPSFRNDPSVKEFIDFRENRLKISSSLFASVLLEELFETGVIIDVLIDVYRKLNDQYSRSESSSALKKLVNYSNLQHILNKKDPKYKANLNYFYDSVHTLSYCAENPYFWLQYAILKLSEYDYVTAEVYFDNAYSFAKKIGSFDTYQIDNHHARFILENEVVSGSAATCMKAFIEAHNLLMNPKHKEDTFFYPYRVAQNYYPFYERFFTEMNDKEKEVFLASCDAMLKRIEWYLGASTIKEGKRDVLRAKDYLTRILTGK